MEYKYPSKEYLENEYLKNGKSVKEIAEENGVTPATVKTHLYEKRVLKNGNKISKETLEKLYNGTENSIMDVARILGTNDRLVSKYLDKYGIPKVNNKYAKSQYNPVNDSEWVRLYTEEKMSANQISKMYNTTHRVVLEHLRRCGIKTRDLQMSQLYCQGNYNISPDLFDYDKMYDMHINQRLSAAVIADIYKQDIKMIQTCLTNLGIPIYSTSNAHLLPITTNTKHNFEASLTQKVRSHCVANLNPLVLKRDGYRCKMCGSTERLEVHHNQFKLNYIIDCIVWSYPQFNIVDNIDELYKLVITNPFYLDLYNMVTLCSTCHHKVHLNENNPISSEAQIIVGPIEK